MEEWVLAGFGGEVDQVGPEGGPGQFVGEAGEVLIDLVEFCELLRSNCFSAATWRLSV